MSSEADHPGHDPEQPDQELPNQAESPTLRDRLRQPMVWGSALAILLIILVWWLWPRGGGLSDPNDPSAEIATQLVREQRQVEVFFPTAGTALRPETREVTVRETAEEEIRAIVELLLHGPLTDNLYRPLPEGVELVAVYLKDGVAYLDLHRPETVPPLAIGSNQERQAVFSLVNSVVTNVDEVGSVVLLWEGRQWPTFAGHLDTSMPLSANMRLVAR